MRHFRSLLLGLALTALATGCTQSVGRYAITVQADPALKSNVTVDLVGVGESEFRLWNKIDMDAYANPNDDRKLAISTGRLKSFELDSEHRSFTIKPDDPIFDKWIAIGGKPRLFVMCNLYNNGNRETGSGNADFRRKILPLETGAWPDKSITIIVHPSGISLLKDPESKFAIK